MECMPSVAFTPSQLFVPEKLSSRNKPQADIFQLDAMHSDLPGKMGGSP